MKTKIIITCSLIITFFVFVYVYDESVKYPSFVTSEEKNEAMSVWESIGLDGIRCVKLKCTKEKYDKTIKSLGLYGMEKYPSHETNHANCKTVTWWDIDLPKEASNFKIEDNGNIRILTSFKQGHMYYAYEIR